MGRPSQRRARRTRMKESIVRVRELIARWQLEDTKTLREGERERERERVLRSCAQGSKKRMRTKYFEPAADFKLDGTGSRL